MSSKSRDVRKSKITCEWDCKSFERELQVKLSTEPTLGAVQFPSRRSVRIEDGAINELHLA